MYQVNQRVDLKHSNAKKAQVSYSKILLTQADGFDKLLMSLGYVTSAITGIGLPSFVFLFGDIVDEFGKDGNIVKVIRPICIDLIIIGAIMWVTSYFYFTFLVVMSERLGRKTRIAYLRAIL